MKTSYRLRDEPVKFDGIRWLDFVLVTQLQVAFGLFRFLDVSG